MYKHTLKKNTPNIFIQAAFICIFLCISQLTALGASVNIGSGTYSQTIKGPAVLSGNINIRIPGSTESATSSQSGIYANNGNSITGTVQSLNIITNSDNIAGITTVGSLIDLEGNCFIQTSGLYSNGITYSGNPGGGGVRLNGNTTIITLGDYAYGVFAMGSQNDYSLITKGTLNISTSGTGSYGIYLHDGTILLNSNTNITTTGAYAHGIYASADSTLQLNGPTSISVTGEGAYALLVDGIAPYSESFISTRANSTDSPNPQQINIDGPIRIYGKGNELLLDLAAGSHVNSQVLEADSGGSIILNFFAPDAQWTTGSGSLISNGAQLQLDFTQGGSWQLPVTDQENLSTTDPSPALVITDTANMTITGSTEIQGAMNTSLSGGDSAKFALVQAQGSNPLDPSLDSMNVVSNNILYTLDNLGIETINGYETFVVTATRKKLSEALPDLGTGAGNLLPDGDSGIYNDSGDGNDNSLPLPEIDNDGRRNSGNDGGGNPFLSAILAQHVNALSLEDITTYIEGAPVLTRVLPVTSITRNLAARVRSNSPVAAATGSGPGPRYIKSNLHTWENYSENWTNNRSFQSNTLGYYGNNTLKRYPLFRVWASPVYLHESEHALKTENRRTGYTANIWGALAGADVTIGPWTIGGGISFGTGKAHSTNSDMARTKDSLEYAGALLYGIWMHDDWVFSLEGVYTRTKNDIRQSTPIMTLKSRVHVDDFSAQAIIGKNFSCNGFQILPNIGLEYARMVQHETTVKGTFEGQIYNLFENGKATQNIWNLPIGLNVSRSFHYKNLEITPAIQARYIASLGDRGTDIRAWRSDAPWISTVMKGVTMDRHTGEIGTSLTIAGERALFSLGYTYQGSKQRNSHMLSGTIGCTF